MSRKGISNADVLEAVNDNLLHCFEWEQVGDIEPRQTRRITYKDFDRAIRASGLLTTRQIIKDKWTNLIASGIITEIYAHGATKADVDLYRMKCSVARWREVPYAGDITIRMSEIDESMINSCAPELSL